MTVFDEALLGTPSWLHTATGERRQLHPDRWTAEADAADEVMLAGCEGPSLDIGCGPGRLTVALAARGIPALGVDISSVAVRLTTRRGGLALRRNVFDQIPGEGRWRHALLADGNVGIGGNPVALLSRVGELLSASGRAVVEVDPPGGGVRRERARMAEGPWFDWAWVGAESIGTVAAVAGLLTQRITEHSGRWFAELEKP
ncbi:class I SAM-dependent methyltransferase [Allokutzneria multivorans]|uniref:Class I SAM-dependent methyltransferase n=1 Tax=Allokutzneria multivorans TaxID=1142134 RepID=A0ABP7S8T0_9PSEU